MNKTIKFCKIYLVCKLKNIIYTVLEIKWNWWFFGLLFTDYWETTFQKFSSKALNSSTLQFSITSDNIKSLLKYIINFFSCLRSLSSPNNTFGKMKSFQITLYSLSSKLIKSLVQVPNRKKKKPLSGIWLE